MMYTTSNAARLLSVVLLFPSLVGGLQLDKRKFTTLRQWNTMSVHPSPTVGVKLWTPEMSVRLLTLMERMNESMASFATQRTVLKDCMSSCQGMVDQRFNKLENKIESISDDLKDKLRQDINVLKEIIKDISTENQQSHNSILGLGPELRNFSNFVVDGINERLDRVTQTFDFESKELLSHFRNVTHSLDDKINDAADTLGNVTVELSGRVDQSLTSIREGIVGDTTELIHQMSNRTELLTEKSRCCERLSKNLDNKFDSLNNTLLTGLENMQIGFDNVSSKIDFYNLPLSFASCKRGMHRQFTPYSYPYPYSIINESINGTHTQKILCDTETAGGGWLIIQYRSKGDTDFFRGWEDYKRGFGSLDTDFWIGLDTIHKLTSSATYELRVEITYKGQTKFAHYNRFSVASEADNYRLYVGGYDGTAGNSLSWHNGMEFSTKDRDNDKARVDSCANQNLGAWWYKNCHYSNLNGKWGAKGLFGPIWFGFTRLNPPTHTEMKIRRLE